MPENRPNLLSTLAVQFVGTFAIIGLILFLPAGTLYWPLGWWFILISLLTLVVTALVLWRTNPAIFAARQKIGAGTKSWDMVLMPAVVSLYLVICIVAGLDNGRFGWSSPPLAIILLGYLLVFVGIGLTAWAQGVNRFFEPTVRIQTDRGHHVIDTGPYRFVRHPGYIAAIALAAGMALALGSWWALLPAALLAALLAVRTELEDATLQRELTGYADFARRVRWKWLPGLY